MNALLHHTIGMPNQGMRAKITAAGFRNMNACSQFDSTYVHNACQTVRKTEGNANTKEVTMEMEHRLVKLCCYAKFQYITGGDMAPGACNMDRLDAVYQWKEQLQDDPLGSSVEVFGEKTNKKVWFESLRGYFSCKKGISGYPLLYVIRDERPDGAAAPVWGTPTMDEYLESQGRHDGRLYAADNTAVWIFIRQKCLGTNAWHCIRSYEATRDGRGAYRALRGQYMGNDVMALLLKQAEYTLDTIWFDGKDKNYTWDMFIGEFREALHDLGPDNQMTEQRKVVKLMSAFQVEHLMYCETIITTDPRLSNSLEAAITFLSQQLISSQLKNGPSTKPTVREIASVDTSSEEEPTEEEPTDEDHPTSADDDESVNELEELKTLQSRMKLLEEQIAKKIAKARENSQDSGDSKSGDSKKRRKWHKMNGDKHRNVSTLLSGDSEPPPKEPRVGDYPTMVAPMPGLQAPSPTLKPPPMKNFTISQRPQLYGKKKTSHSHLSEGTGP